MNILQFLKSGSGIHIKKENRGKFTDYCGGKVTSECIAKGKRSSNPAIRKRATFAGNARKWKHEDGGRVKKHQAFVNGVSVLDSNPDAYKYVKKKIKKAADGDNTQNWQTNSNKWNTLNVFGKSVLEQLPSIVGAFQSSSSAKQQAKANELSDNVSEQELFQNYYQTELDNLLKNPTQFTTNGELINNSPIVAQTQAYQIAWNKAKAAMMARRNKTKLDNAQLLAEGNSKITNAITGTIGNLAQTGLEYLNYKKSNKNNSSQNTSGTSSSSSNYSDYAGADGMA